ncbi:hypothetical protein PFISCL1PPCAC_11431, partial [Pristionchus fissidentatus]
VSASFSHPLHSLCVHVPLHSHATAGSTDGSNNGRSLPLSIILALLRVLRGQSVPMLLLLRDLGTHLFRHSFHASRRWRSGCGYSICTRCKGLINKQ